VEVFAKNYCLHWQKRNIGDKIAQFGSCTFTPRTRKTSAEVVDIVPCARSKWGNWWYFWFYVAPRDIEVLPSLPLPSCAHIAMWLFHILRWQKKMKTKGPFGMWPT
jgi:hypothetical protein